MTDVRLATAVDLDGLVELWAALGADGHRADRRYRFRDDAAAIARTILADGWLDDRRCTLVAAAHGRLVGCMAVLPVEPHPVLDEPPTWRVTDAYVSPSHRRRGLGRRLFAAAHDVAVARGAVSLEVGTLALDERAVAFWRSLGFGDWRVTLQCPAVAGALG
ncbi:MAG: GNAT family N-acetyltransferase [Actinomycetota bacterium]|nr:GNAT family N-acetyltransferase [Actinomycetota bacterium]